MAAGDQDFRPLGGAADAENEHLDPLSLAVTLGADLLFLRQNRLRPAQVQGDGASGVGGFDDTGHNVAFVLGKFLEKQFALRFPQTLQDNLLGGLGGNAAGVVGQRLCGGHFVADDGAFLYLRGLGHRDFPFRVLDHVNHGLKGVDADFPAVWVQRDGNVLPRGWVVLLERRSQRNLNGA